MHVLLTGVDHAQLPVRHLHADSCLGFRVCSGGTSSSPRMLTMPSFLSDICAQIPEIGS